MTHPAGCGRPGRRHRHRHRAPRPQRRRRLRRCGLGLDLDHVHDRVRRVDHRRRTPPHRSTASPPRTSTTTGPAEAGRPTRSCDRARRTSANVEGAAADSEATCPRPATHAQRHRATGALPTTTIGHLFRVRRPTPRRSRPCSDLHGPRSPTAPAGASATRGRCLGRRGGRDRRRHLQAQGVCDGRDDGPAPPLGRADTRVDGPTGHRLARSLLPATPVTPPRARPFSPSNRRPSRPGWSLVSLRGEGRGQRPRRAGRRPAGPACCSATDPRSRSAARASSAGIDRCPAQGVGRGDHVVGVISTTWSASSSHAPAPS